jgi:putative hydrolase of the HAD superfamily
MTTPRVISLDLDDTLWPVAPVIEAAEAELTSWLHTHHPRAMEGHDLESMRRLRARVAARHPGQRHDMTFLRRQALAEQFAEAGYEAAPVEEALEVFFRGRNRVVLYPDVLPALERLSANYRLFAVSNGNADLERCGIARWFEGHITAAAAGAAKPDPRIFEQLLRAAQVPAPEVLHIGDDPLADVVGATRAGMQSVWLNREARTWPPGLAPPDRIVTTLAEID